MASARLPVLFGLVLLLAACGSLPRGAALRSEILQTQTLGAEQVRDFEVAPVTRALLPVYAAWPGNGGTGHSWIERVDQPQTRIIAPGDSLSITIWSTEENGLLTAPGQRFVSLPEQRVGANGTVFLPYVGTIKVSGMSPETARDRVEAEYADVTPSAQVQLGFAEGRQNTVSLVAGVAQPGSYPLPDNDFTVMGLIAEGGGVDKSLRNPQIRLTRDGRIYGTSVERLLGNPRLDTTLKGGDKIHVEADDRKFLSLGAAGTESVHYFTEDRLDALEAMAIIGGVSDSRADPGGILVLRRYPAQAVTPGAGGPDQSRVVFTIDLTSADGLFSAGEFEILPGDLVYATESPVTSATTIFGLLGTSLGLASRVGVSF
ncbi:MAG: polysaccharide biosynthesis/export family protein [Limimaricola soesokkakensis]|uniref:Polysaccharide biosynthesis/export protein n=1 Tax=Limimaricola soesokkakensis TaxID=1343159 RepID=A0A1X7A1B4_9RHOB|nr:polysaccharide biosynthesis/export family protein [Limimaricola soesokkakensis]PSK82529.1 polysaccharide export outer membrane protein [Limimaricola soesokkakensis]SLN65780.1 Polysaccharide biosynthesis/export protein [Limimaricola soesokkakensis]